MRATVAAFALPEAGADGLANGVARLTAAAGVAPTGAAPFSKLTSAFVGPFPSIELATLAACFDAVAACFEACAAAAAAVAAAFEAAAAFSDAARACLAVRLPGCPVVCAATGVAVAMGAGVGVGLAVSVGVAEAPPKKLVIPDVPDVSPAHPAKAKAKTTRDNDSAHASCRNSSRLIRLCSAGNH